MHIRLLAAGSSEHSEVCVFIGKSSLFSIAFMKDL